jgi:hypothetical protein
MTQTAASASASSAGRPGSQVAVIFEHVPHPHIDARKATGPAKTSDLRIKGRGAIGRLNARFGVLITVAVGTMWCAYLFTVLALVSLPAALQSHDRLIIVAWIAQTFLQLVLLPIIIVGQNVQAAASDQRAEDTYMDAEAVLHEALQIQAHLQAQDEILQRLASGAMTDSAAGGDTETRSAGP